MQPLTLHISPCPNDTFMFEAIINQRIDISPFTFNVEYHDIEQLNQAALDVRADISKVSCAILPQIAPSYTLLESGAALGRGNGPLLVCRKGLTSPLRRVAIPGQNTTAALLLSYLYPQVEQTVPMLFSDIATAIEQNVVDAGVLIHEGRFLYAQRNLDLIADLGLLWEQRLSLPLPLGAIVMRSSLDVTLRRRFEEILHASITWAMEHPYASRPLIRQHARELNDTVIDSHIDLFVNQYSLSLGREGHRAIAELCSVMR